MTAAILDGKSIAEKVRADVAERAAAFLDRTGRKPRLDVILVGDDPASHVYVRNKETAARQVGFAGTVHRLATSTSQAALLSKVRELDDEPEIDGILVQLPLPPHIDPMAVVDAIDPDKDVDGLTPTSTGKLWVGRAGLRPCTPLGCMRLLDEALAAGLAPPLDGARAVVIGRSNLVGKPLAAMLLERHATVLLTHSKTRDLADRVREADIVVAAVGKASLVQGSWIRDGAVVIDVGINRTAEGKLVGDVDFEGARARARAITPVPGGVGPMTIAMLLANTIAAAEERARIR